MNTGFLRIIAAAPEDRRGLFLATANRLGTLFKGGTSLSKAYGLISRFSEDIDITGLLDALLITYSSPESLAVGGLNPHQSAGQFRRNRLCTFCERCATFQMISFCSKFWLRWLSNHAAFLAAKP
jgi:hypothetical protein